MGNGKDGVGGRLCSSIPRPVNIGKAIKLSTGSSAFYYSIDTEQIGTKKEGLNPRFVLPKHQFGTKTNTRADENPSWMFSYHNSSN